MNNLATTEGEIVAMGVRLAGAGSQVGMSEAQILSLSGSLSSVGIAAESGGSAFSKLLINMNLATKKGGKDLDAFAKASGVSASEFKKAFEDDAAGALQMFLDGLAGAEAQGKDAILMLDEMGIEEIRLRDAILRAAGANELFSESMELGKKAWNENTALTKEAAERYKTLESQLAMAKNRIIDVAIELGGTLAPHLIKIADKVAYLTESFGKIPKPVQTALTVITLLTVALGGTLRIVGSVIGAITSIGTGLMSLAGAMGLAGAATATAGGAIAGLGGTLIAGLGLIAPWLVAIGGIAAAGVSIYKTMKEKTIPEIDRFGNSVSDSTKEAVGSYLDLEEKVNKSLTRMAWSNSEVTKGMAKSIVETTTQMSDQIIAEYDRQKDDSLKSLQKMLNNSQEMSDEKKEQMIQSTKDIYDSEIEYTKRGQEKIDAIMKQALEDKRKISTDEQEMIDEIMKDMNEQAIVLLTENEKEQLAIKERLISNKKALDTQEAADLAKEAINKKDKIILEADKEYNERLKLAGEFRLKGTKESVQMASDIVAEANRQRTETVHEAEQAHFDIIEQAQAQAKSHIEEVDWETGEVKSKWQKFKEDIGIVDDEAKIKKKNNNKEISDDTAKANAKMQEDTKGAWVLTGEDVKRGAAKVQDTLGLHWSQMTENQRVEQARQEEEGFGSWRKIGQFIKEKSFGIRTDVDANNKGITSDTHVTWSKHNSETEVSWGSLGNIISTKAKEIKDSIFNWFSLSVSNTKDAWNQAKSDGSRIWGEIWGTISGFALSIYNTVKDKFTATSNSISKAWTDTKTETSRLWGDIKTTVWNKANEILTDVKALPGKMAQGIKDGKSKLVGAFTEIFNAAKTAIAKPVNGILSGANHVLKLLGAPELAKWDVTKYEKGTSGSGHAGGAAMVNDQKGGVYREAVKLPDGREFIPEGRNVIIPNLPKGSHVIPARETKQIYQYAKGTKGAKEIAKNVIDGGKNLISKGKEKALDIWDYASKPLDLAKEALSGRDLLGGIKKGFPLDAAKALVSKATTQMGEFIKGKFGEMSFGGESGGIDFDGLRVTSPFGMRTHPIFGTKRMHSGIDYAGGRGLGHVIKSQMGGIVNHSGNMGGYGNTVKVKLGNLEHMYAHLSKTLVGVGSSVSRGQPIGLMGSTGNSTGNHVHYETRQNGKAVNPATVHNQSGGSSSPLGTGVERWRGTVIKALGMNGLPTSPDYVNAWLRQIKTESGGNAQAVQGRIGDINNRTGDLAKGLVQVIGATFNRYKFPGHNNRFSGLDSLLAGMNYAKTRYKGRMLSVIGRGRGYSEGTDSSEGGYTSVGEDGEELVIYPDGTIDLSGDTAEVRNLPKGTQVLNNEETQKVKSGANSHKIHAFGNSGVTKNVTLPNADINSNDFKMKIISSMDILENNSNSIPLIYDKISLLSQYMMPTNIDRATINESWKNPKNLLKENNLSNNDNYGVNSQNSGINIHIDKMQVREEADIDKIATELKRKTDRENKARGIR